MTFVHIVIAIAVLCANKSASASDLVSVLWRANLTDRHGRVHHSSPLPPQNYIEIVNQCGHTIDLHTRIDQISASILNCPGVLNFAQSEEFKRILQEGARKFLAPRQSNPYDSPIISKLDQLRFATSQYGIFISPEVNQRFRYVGLNVASLKLVIINPYFYSQITDPELRFRFLYHEASGALGYRDENYQISTSTKPVFRPTDLEASGASVVGRGGDSNHIAFKLSLIRALNKPLQLSVAGVPKRFLPTRNEMLTAVENAEVLGEGYDFFRAHPDLCIDVAKGGRGEQYCGGFLLYGPRQRPTILIYDTWATSSDREPTALLMKVLTQMVFQMSNDKQKRNIRR